MFQIIKDAATTIVALVGAYVGLVGLATWKRTLEGQKRFDSALELGKCLRVLEDNFNYVRAPMIHGGEIHEAYRALNEEHDPNTDPVKRATAVVFRWKFQKLSDSWSAFVTSSYYLEALFVPGLVEPRTALRKIIGELQWAIKDYENAEQFPSNLSRCTPKIWSRGDDDPFGQRFNVEVTRFMEVLRPLILVNEKRTRRIPSLKSLTQWRKSALSSPIDRRQASEITTQEEVADP